MRHQQSLGSGQWLHIVVPNFQQILGRSSIIQGDLISAVGTEVFIGNTKGLFNHSKLIGTNTTCETAFVIPDDSSLNDARVHGIGSNICFPCLSDSNKNTLRRCSNILLYVSRNYLSLYSWISIDPVLQLYIFHSKFITYKIKPQQVKRVDRCIKL